MPEKQNQPTWKDVICQQCGVTFAARISNLKRGKMKYCSRLCFNKSTRTGELPPIEFNGIRYRVTRYGYYQPYQAGKMLHRVIWEQHHGPIPVNCRIYFRDGMRSNYALENLILRKLKPRPLCRTPGCERKTWTGRSWCKQCFNQIPAEERKQSHRREARTRKMEALTQSLTEKQ